MTGLRLAQISEMLFDKARVIAFIVQNLQLSSGLVHECIKLVKPNVNLSNIG
ncbi:MAG: hypothetical protein HC862_05410 [Scytonema sp. RU_4_4]|nr:hypothetical protein [Scytonema sp. RU_4_4]NJR75194.1 hypothetical protein [Scytonema sp. CRU_2_7]